MEGHRFEMKHGDCLVLNGQLHAVPPAVEARPRLSVCLFYASVEECLQGEARVLSGGSFWWSHPEDDAANLWDKERSQDYGARNHIHARAEMRIWWPKYDDDNVHSMTMATATRT